MELSPEKAPLAASKAMSLQSNAKKYRTRAKFSVDVSDVFKLIVVLLILYFIGSKINKNDIEYSETQGYIAQPNVNDIYFLDLQELTRNLRPNERYRVAKVVDITGHIVTLQYGNMLYPNKQSVIDGIRYGQLRYNEYLEPKRYDFSLQSLTNLYNKGAIYKIKRPVHDVLYGNNVSPDKNDIYKENPAIYIPGKRQYIEANAIAKAVHTEDYIEQSLALWQQSAELGYAQGQVALGEAYLSSEYTEDLTQALYWFKQASLQSNKAGILKYEIVCKQVAHCNIVDFYQQLVAAGVNIKVRAIDFSLSESTEVNKP